MYQRILVPVDGSPTSNRGLNEAIRLALVTHAAIRLIHIIDEQSSAFAADSFANFSDDMLQQLRKEGQTLVDACQAKVHAAGVPVDSALHDNLSGTVAELVLNEARSWRADLIVLGTHGRRGFKRLMVGSSAESIVRAAAVPVLLVKSSEDATKSP